MDGPYELDLLEFQTMWMLVFDAAVGFNLGSDFLSNRLLLYWGKDLKLLRFENIL
jgi:hypothetical protein